MWLCVHACECVRSKPAAGVLVHGGMFPVSILKNTPGGTYRV